MTAIEFSADPGEIRAPADWLGSLLRGPADRSDLADALEGAGALVDGRPHPWLAAALATAAEPTAELRLERGPRRAQGWVSPAGTVLAHPLPDGRSRLVVVGGHLLPIALARLNGLGPRPRPPAVRIALSAGALAETLATGTPAAEVDGPDERSALAAVASGLDEHWRVEASWRPAEGSTGVRAVEVLDTAGGLWLVVPDDPTVELWPTTPTAVFRALCAILPFDHEVAR